MVVMSAGEAAVTPREVEVLAAAGSHLTNAQIASRLHPSERTVESNVVADAQRLFTEMDCAPPA
jgi:DNA-binding NarL/FixJ family response regulator